MRQQEMKDRTKVFCIRVIKLSETIIKKSEIGKIIGRQVMRSSTSVAANYRALTRSKSKADFINKLRIVEEELDETLFWIELIESLELIKQDRLTEIKKETAELLAIIAVSGKTARSTKS